MEAWIQQLPVQADAGVWTAIETPWSAWMSGMGFYKRGKAGQVLAKRSTGSLGFCNGF